MCYASCWNQLKNCLDMRYENSLENICSAAQLLVDLKAYRVQLKLRSTRCFQRNFPKSSEQPSLGISLQSCFWKESRGYIMEKGSTMTIVIGQPCNLDYVIYFYEPIRQVIAVCFENLTQKDKMHATCKWTWIRANVTTKSTLKKRNLMLSDISPEFLRK